MNFTHPLEDISRHEGQEISKDTEQIDFQPLSSEARERLQFTDISKLKIKANYTLDRREPSLGGVTDTTSSQQ